MDKPNIIFIFSDQQHYKASGYKDGFFDTPNLDRLASESFIFNNVYCTTPLCSPSRATLMTGRYPHKVGVEDNGMVLKERTIGSFLQEAGYYTGYFGKWHLKDDEEAIKGWDEKEGVYDEYRMPNRPLSDEETLSYAKSFIARNSDKKPFAMFVSFDEPHGIYFFSAPQSGYPLNFCKTPTESEDTPLPFSCKEKKHKIIPDAVRQPSSRDDKFKNESDSVWKRYRELYKDRVKAYDSSLGTLLSDIEAKGLFDNTIIITTSDHGDMDASHRLPYKGPYPYEEVQRVPLTIRMPKSPTKTEINSLVSNVDLFPTIMDIAGNKFQRDGISLMSILNRKTKEHEREYAVVQFPKPRLRTLIKDSYKYSLYEDGSEILFNIAEDPYEMRDVLEDNKEVGKTMREALMKWIKEEEDPFSVI